MARKTVKRIKLSNNKAEEVELSKKVPKKQPSADKTPKQSEKPALATQKPAGKNYILLPFTATYGYFKGSWQELQQVRWPNRRATWGLTLAVILFTAFFVLIIVALDSAFQYLFKEVLLK